MKIFIFGASCAGVTTTGKLLAELFNIPYFDTDDFFWEDSEVPYTIRRNPEERNKLLNDSLNHSSNGWILGGSIHNWDISLHFSLAIFLWVPQSVRLKRLESREVSKFGNIIFTDPTRNQKYIEFMTWAAGYDDNSARGRNLASHENWIKTLKCPVLEIRGNLKPDEVLQLIQDKIISLK